MRLTTRGRAALFVNYALPLAFLFVSAGLFDCVSGTGISFFAGAALTIGILGNGLWGAGMRAVPERESNSRIKAAPISLLTAGMAAGWLLYMPAVVLVTGLAHFAYGMPFPRQWFSLLLMVSLGICSFRALGLMLAAVANSRREAAVLILLFYLPMLTLSGATVPAAMLPNWAQTVAEFTPAPYLVRAIQGMLLRNQTILDHGWAALSLGATLALGLFGAVKLFRREKEERIPTRNKLWAVAALAPFLVMGGIHAFTGEHLYDNAALYRQLQRSGSFLIRNARIFTAAGRTIERGAVLVRDGKIAEIYEGAGPDPLTLQAGVVEGAGKTLLPGLIDVHVHLGAPGGVSNASEDYDAGKAMPRAAAALLYSGVTTARSVGDSLNASLKLRAELASGAKLGAQLFVCGPMFTAGGGQGEELIGFAPPALRQSLRAQWVRTPNTPEEARRQVRGLKAAGVDGLKAILEAGWGDGMLSDRFDLLLARSVAEEASAQNLPLATHTGDARDVADAVEIGSTSIEHGAWRDELPDALLERMARQGVFYDPTLVVAEAYARYYGASSELLNDALTRHAVSARLLQATRDFVASGKGADPAKAALFEQSLTQARANLLRVWQAGAPLAMGTDAGNPLVFHGPSLHRELQLWVQAGIPPPVALEAATANAARLLRAANRIGSIRKGLEADLLLVDGNPLEDIAATERISLVVLKGERIRRDRLIDPK